MRQLTNSSGDVTDSYDYDAFGNLINSTGSTPNNYLFAGEQYDSALGLYYNRARYYNNTTGRFWSIDDDEGDLDSPISLHMYLYSSADPANRKDPSGQDDLAEFTIAQAVGGVITAMAVQLGTAAGFVYGTFLHLPKDAFLQRPSAKIAGVQLSYPIGKLIRQFPRNPFVIGLSLGFMFSAFTPEFEVLYPSQGNSLWLYFAPGVTVGLKATSPYSDAPPTPFNLNGLRLSQLYYGEAYNLKGAGDYTGSFFCTSGGAALAAYFTGLPIAPSLTVCSGLPDQFGNSAYSWTVGAGKTSNPGINFGASYSYYIELTELNW